MWGSTDIGERAFAEWLAAQAAAVPQRRRTSGGLPSRCDFWWSGEP